jgi:hypothetical protein
MLRGVGGGSCEAPPYPDGKWMLNNNNNNNNNHQQMQSANIKHQ